MRAWMLVLIMAPALAGCLSGGGTDDAVLQPDTGLTPVEDRHRLPFATDGPFSTTLEAGPHGILPGRQVFIDVPLDPTEGAPAAADMTHVSIGLHMPDIPGCDWEAEELPASCQVPVIADVGPYYSATVGQEDLQLEGDRPVDEVGYGRLFGFMVDNFVPHGYAVAAVSVFGTGDSGHCMDLMGRAEQAGVQGAVEHLGTAPWSNGAVGLIGRSYDGSTPWEAAMVESDHLKTIVPISGLQGQHDLMWRNGSAEARGPGILYGLYATMTIDGEPHDAAQVLCPDYLQGGPMGGLAYLTGDQVADAANPYWTERYFFDDALANYDGSVYYIHGLQDWNVDNHQAFPYYNHLLDAGFEMKGLFGQWAHMYPDRASEHERLPSGKGAEAFPASVRHDWAQDLLEWFDHYLKGTGPQPQLHVEVQDNLGGWRIEQDYPPRDALLVEQSLADAERLHDGPDVLAGPALFGQGLTRLEYVFPALSESEDTRIAGNVLFRPQVTPTGPGGQIGATLYDAETGLRLGHGIMDLRYHAGGKDMQAVVPGMTIVPQFEFLAMDVVLPAGHGLHLVLTPTVEDYLPAAVDDPVLIEGGGLLLPVVERDGSTSFVPPS